jgi:hypothetical protein
VADEIGISLKLKTILFFKAGSKPPASTCTKENIPAYSSENNLKSALNKIYG